MKLNTILRYPKPGRFNPTVRAFSATVKGIKATPRASQLNPPAFFDNKERIIYSVVWATNNEVKEIPITRGSLLLYSTMLHLQPLRFHGVGVCWD
jgi:hypothetical protein